MTNERGTDVDKLEVIYCSLWTGPEQGEWYAVKKAFVSPTVIVKHQSTGTGSGEWVYQSVCVNAWFYLVWNQILLHGVWKHLYKRVCECGSWCTRDKSLLFCNCFLHLLLWCRGLSVSRCRSVFVYGDQRDFFLCYSWRGFCSTHTSRRGVVMVGECVCRLCSKLESSLHTCVPLLVWRLR